VLARMGMCLLMVCGVGVVVVGLVPEDVNSGAASHRGGVTFSRGRHGNDGGRVQLRRWFGCWFGSISAAAGVAVVVATVALGEGGGAWVEEVGAGTVERVAAYGIAGWMVAVGTYLYSRISSRPGRNAADSPAESECGWVRLMVPKRMGRSGFPAITESQSRILFGRNTWGFRRRTPWTDQGRSKLT